jgi:hypothetical protein
MPRADVSGFYSRSCSLVALTILSGSGATGEAGAFWMIVFDISVITAMQGGYIGGTALFVAVAD